MLYNSNNTISYKNNSKPSISNNEESFFIEALNMIREENIEINRMISESFYNSNSKSPIETILSKIDFKKIILGIINAFLKLLDYIFRQFIAAVMELMNKDRIIKNFKDHLRNLSQPINFKGTYRVYTNLGNSTSYTSFENELNKELSNLILSVVKLRDYKTLDGLIKNIEELKNSIDLTDNYFDEVRGNMLGSREPIKEENFASALFNYFRSNGDQVDSTIIPPFNINQSLDFYLNYKSNFKAVRKDKDDLEKSAKKIEKEISNIKLNDYIREDLPSQAQTMFANVITNTIKRLKMTCELYGKFFAAKLDAIREKYEMDRQVLFTACKQIVKRGAV